MANPQINPFTSLSLSILGDVVTVAWTVSPFFQGRAPYSFVVQAFEDNTFTTPIYSLPSVTTFYATDNKNLRQNFRLSFLYKVQLTTADSVVYNSNFVGWSPDDQIQQHHYLLASEITRREHVRFNYTGLYCYLLKRKSYNPIATSEVDPVTNEPTVDSSGGSYGVGMTGGYYTPCLFRLSIEAREVKEGYEQSGDGVQRSELLRTRTAGFPYLEVQDIVVFSDGKRYIIVDPGNKYFPGTTLVLLQLSTMQLVPPTDTIYNITVPTTYHP